MARLAGTWTLRAIENEAGWRQRIVISGSNAHDGGHEMVVGDEIHGVQGEEMTLTPQAFDPTLGDWIDSLEQERAAWDDAIGMTLTIFADDNPAAADGDFNDLVVLCLPEDPELQTPHTFPRPDLTIPESKVHFQDRLEQRRREVSSEHRRGNLGSD
jgi:hypothetical protein